MIELQTFILLIVVLVVFSAGIVYFLSNKLSRLKQELKGDESDVLMQWLKEMKASVEKNTETLDTKLNSQRTTLEEQLKNQRQVISDQTKVIWERLDNASEVIRTVQKQMSGIQEFGSDIKDLSNILKSPKLRGGLGEQFLYEILANILPTENYKTQYKFKDGSVCDAVVFMDKGLIPIDSKFPMENFKAMLTVETPEQRDRAKKLFISDVKKRIDEIAGKYILPEEGTTDQALMYLPSENVYYELIVNTPEIEEYAKNKSVVIVSPNTISYFLKVLLIAYQQHELQKHAGDILKALSGIKIEAGKFNEELGVLEKHISNSNKTMETVRSKFGKLFGKIESAQALEGGEQKKLLESN